jgi:hypothetical protein
MAAAEIFRHKEALRYYKKALKCNPTNKQASMILVNMASVLIDQGKYREAIPLCKEAMELNPESKKAPANLGFALLAIRDWENGWEPYRASLGTEWRPLIQYRDEPLWDGESRGTIAIYAEQGIGDVISFGSMIPDMIEWAKENDSRVILEVDPKLENLYKRTFPEITVYGTRGQQGVMWHPDDQAIDYSLPVGQLGQYFRSSPQDFPAGDYLTPCPVRTQMWKDRFESGGKPVIGLAWRGGIHRTGARYRQFDLEQLLPILRSCDAQYVSLQYKPSGKEIEEFRKKHPDIDIVEYPWATLTDDYDDTVALIAALDGVICMQTAVVHTAGALGVPVDVFVQANSQWRYGEKDKTDLVWADSVKIWRQKQLGNWDSTIRDYVKNADFGRLQKATGRTAQEPRLRSNGAALRQNGKGADSAGEHHASA